MAEKALVNPLLLSWARQRSGLSETSLASKLRVREERVSLWEAGKESPTFKQAQKFANLTHIPFGFLFLQSPPYEEFPIPDLRTVEGRQVELPSNNLREVVKNVIFKQSWYREYLISNGAEPLSFVGSISTHTPIEEAAKVIRDTLKVDFPTKGSWEEYQRTIISAAESVGILVMRSGIVGNNTHRKLEVSEFRGFAITDEYAPVVFVNSSDAPAARLFTLIHEVVHIWLGSSGISNMEPANVEEEVFCNATAGEFLVPKALLLELWDIDSPMETNISFISGRFHVSKMVVARRAADVGLVTRAQYNEFYRDELRAFQQAEGGGGDFYRTAGSKNSLSMSKAIISETQSGRLLLRDAGKLLGVPPNGIGKYARTLST
ncbi:ImmA/IrrE family metallo-endopeptidase [Alteromonas australica]|uniref:ImmA/IrrE family metallo-endopeptidase n=1 Tax=Alteromonas australica TaxID=589873 RepID=UPI0035C868E2